MFQIGEFSRIAQTAVSQLRYYDQIGLFQPKHTDPSTGYRYYQAAQLPDLNRILAMKELGLTLEQIKRLTDDNVSPEELRGMLSLKKSQIEQEIHAQFERLQHVEARLRQAERDGEIDNDDIVLKELPAQPFFGFRAVLPDIRKSAPLLGEMRRLLPGRVSPKALGRFVARFHTEAFMLEDADVEMGFLLNETVDAVLTLSNGLEMKPSIFPLVETAACVVRVGGVEKGYESYANIGRWVEANGYALTGQVREMFIVPPHPDRIEETVCEIQVPVTVERRPPLLSTS